MTNNAFTCEDHGLRFENVYKPTPDTSGSIHCNNNVLPHSVTDGEEIYCNDHVIYGLNNTEVNIWWSNSNIAFPISKPKWSDCDDEDTCSTMSVCFSHDITPVIDALPKLELFREQMVELL